MRRILPVLILLLSFTPLAAQASFDTSKTWFERLSQAERSDIQADLILLGHYHLLVDGRFGRATFDAIEAFQKSQGATASGILGAEELATLRRSADKIQVRLGMQEVTDEMAHVSMIIPTNLLTQSTPTEHGTSYVSDDAEISLETMYTTLADYSFRDLYDIMTAPDPERIVTLHSFGESRFFVAGTVGEYAFYSMFLTAGDAAVGYSLAWGKRYAEDGAITAVWLASHFTPVTIVPPAEPMTVASASLR
jgi:hypothetical protein